MNMCICFFYYFTLFLCGLVLHYLFCSNLLNQAALEMPCSSEGDPKVEHAGKYDEQFLLCRAFVIIDLQYRMLLSVYN